MTAKKTLCKKLLAVVGVIVLPMLAAVGITASVHASRNQRQSSGAPKWEAVSIRPCADRSAAVGGRRSSSGGSGGRGETSPGRLVESCRTVLSLIRVAYLLYPSGRGVPELTAMQTEVTGGPSWINSDRYDINAKAEGNPTPEMMQGPMLQGLLEERFQLKIHRESRDVPVYALMVARSGSKLQRFKEGSCMLIDFNAVPAPSSPSGTSSNSQSLRRCRALATRNGSLMVIEAEGISLDALLKMYRFGLDRPVIDRTGITGLFDVHLEFAFDDSAASAGTTTDVAGTSIFTALQEQLGLRLESTTAPADRLVIDRVERPSAN